MSKQILIIDDDPDFIEIQSTVLTRAGFSVESAPNSREGLERLGRDPLPDLIIVDLMMERDDSGFTFCHAVKANPRTKKVPVLMLTAVARDRMIGFDLKSPSAREWIKADDFADKPVRAEVLLAKVRHLLGEPADGHAGAH